MHVGKYDINGTHLVLIVAMIVGLIGYVANVQTAASLVKAEIHKEELVATSEIEKEKTIQTATITEHEGTERTEERSQFWQKLIPWGDDETEKNE